MSGHQKIEPLVKLRNEKAVVDAASFAEEELQGHLDLKLLDSSKTGLAKLLIALIKSISFGQDRAVVSKSVYVLIEYLAQPTVQMDAQYSAEVIEREISRRENEREQIAIVQETLENERDEKRDRLEILGQSLEHSLHTDTGALQEEKDSLEKTLRDLDRSITSIIRAVSAYDREGLKLQAYLSALHRIEQGLPDEIVGKKLVISLK